VRSVLDLLMVELMEAVQELLSLAAGIARCAENAVRINNQVIVLQITFDGRILLWKDKQHKVVQNDLLLEIVDEQGYTA